MIVNIYLSRDKVIKSHVDETLRHQRGDTLSIDESNYIVVKIDEFEHLDYQSIVKINTLVPASTEEIEEIH